MFDLYKPALPVFLADSKRCWVKIFFSIQLRNYKEKTRKAKEIAKI